MTARQNSAAVTDVTFHSTHRKGYQSKLLFFHSKGGRCSFWGLLYCDDLRSPWWASRDGLQHDHIRSDTVMIRMNFNSNASLVIFFIISVFFLTLNFIKEIKKLVPRTLFSSMSTWEYLRTLEKCEKHEPKASASPCLYNSTMNSARFSFL